MTFQQEICEYADKTHANAWRLAISQGATPDEPALVSSFLSKQMYRGLREIIKNHVGHGTKVMVRGIFTHQTPKVQLLTQTKGCEIADLMLVRQHFYPNRRAPATGHALLLQAKKSSVPRTGSVAKGTQACQFELYRDWSPFTGLTRLPAAPAGSQVWDFRQGGGISQAVATTCSEYLTVFDQHAFSCAQVNPQWKAQLTKESAFQRLANNYPANCTWSAGGRPIANAAANNGVACLDDFGTVFEAFFNGNRGRSFQPGVITGPDHWSIFVNLMLQISARANGNYAYTSKNQGVVAGMRGRNLYFSQAVPTLWHSLEEELDNFLEAKSSSNGDHFSMTNQLLELIRQTRDDSEEPPPPSEIDFFKRSPLGHVPLLLVTTSGNDLPHI